MERKKELSQGCDGGVPVRECLETMLLGTTLV